MTRGGSIARKRAPSAAAAQLKIGWIPKEYQSPSNGGDQPAKKNGQWDQQGNQKKNAARSGQEKRSRTTTSEKWHQRLNRSGHGTHRGELKKWQKNRRSEAAEQKAHRVENHPATDF